jgi:hypothetical protein
VRKEAELEDEVHGLEGQICKTVEIRRRNRLDEDALETGVTTGSDMARARGVRQRRVVEMACACMRACECPRAPTTDDVHEYMSTAHLKAQH